MSKDEMWSEIGLLFKEINKSYIQLPIPKINIDQIRYDEMLHVYRWMNDFHKLYFQPLHEVYLLLPPHVWAQYKDFDLTDSREAKMLKEASEKFKLQWKQRPKLLRTREHKKHNKQKGTGSNNPRSRNKNVKAQGVVREGNPR